MKKILFIALLLVMSRGAYAQTGSVTIINHTDHTAVVRMYGWAIGTCTSPCDATFIGNPIMINDYSTWTTSDPCTFSSTPGYAATGCLSFLCPYSSLPASYIWSQAEVMLLGDCGADVFVADILGCGGHTDPSPSTGCFGTDYAVWSPLSGVAFSDVTIDIY